MTHSWPPPIPTGRPGQSVPQVHRQPVQSCMATFPVRVLGVLALILSITLPSCQAVFTQSSSINAPQRLSPGFFQTDRR